MAKHRRRNGPAKMVQAVPIGPGEATSDELRYAFDSAARCPGCGSTDCIVVKTDGQIRYWRCRTPHCHFSEIGGRRTWKEIGTAI